jgi:hypothetical protein
MPPVHYPIGPHSFYLVDNRAGMVSREAARPASQPRNSLYAISLPPTSLATPEAGKSKPASWRASGVGTIKAWSWQ